MVVGALNDSLLIKGNKWRVEKQAGLLQKSFRRELVQLNLVGGLSEIVIAYCSIDLRCNNGTMPEQALNLGERCRRLHEI